MQIGSVTTPFGRRPAKLCLIRGQLDAGKCDAGKKVDKWRVFHDTCEARTVLGIADRALAVLNALLTFYPDRELATGAALVVFPSNSQLSLRAHGIAGTTLRRHLAALVDAGLIIRHDSPNGKRYRHKNDAGETDQAYGFSLAPLLSRSEELAALAADIVADRNRLRVLRERLTICRRDVRKLISSAIEEGASGDWFMIESLFIALLARLPRTPVSEIIGTVLEEMEMLRDEIVNLLNSQLKAGKTDSNDVQSGRHIQNSNPESTSEFEPAFEQKQGERSVTEAAIVGGKAARRAKLLNPGQVAVKSFPLAMVLRACPDIAMYGPGGGVSSWRDLMAAAVVVRSMLGVSPSAYEEACQILGPENAAAVMGCILERGGHINSAGGYLRSLTDKARVGEFSIGPMLMALWRQSTDGSRLSG